MPKALQITPDKCTSCLQCEMACSAEHDGIFNPGRSRIKVFEYEHGKLNVPYTCTQCTQAWCLHACPTNAISVDTLLGAKIVNDELCVGCKACTIACPYGTLQYQPERGKVAKCDLCGGDPACARACPTGAIVYA